MIVKNGHSAHFTDIFLMERGPSECACTPQNHTLVG